MTADKAVVTNRRLKALNIEKWEKRWEVAEPAIQSLKVLDPPTDV
jgi:hypothetical protein